MWPISDQILGEALSYQLEYDHEDEHFQKKFDRSIFCITRGDELKTFFSSVFMGVFKKLTMHLMQHIMKLIIY